MKSLNFLVYGVVMKVCKVNDVGVANSVRYVKLRAMAINVSSNLYS